MAITEGIKTGLGLASQLGGAAFNAIFGSRSYDRQKRENESKYRSLLLNNARQRNAAVLEDAASRYNATKALGAFNSAVANAQGRAAVSGGTNASVAAAKANANAALANVHAQNTAAGQAKTERLDSERNKLIGQQHDSRIALEQQRAQGMNTAAQNLADVGYQTATGAAPYYGGGYRRKYYDENDANA